MSQLFDRGLAYETTSMRCQNAKSAPTRTRTFESLYLRSIKLPIGPLISKLSVKGGEVPNGNPWNQDGESGGSLLHDFLFFCP